MSYGGGLVVSITLATTAPGLAGVIPLAISIGLTLPTWAVVTRRLHDTNRSGWWWLIALTIIGLIPMIMWLAKEGDKTDNRFGPPSK